MAAMNESEPEIATHEKLRGASLSWFKCSLLLKEPELNSACDRFLSLTLSYPLSFPIMPGHVISLMSPLAVARCVILVFFFFFFFFA